MKTDYKLIYTKRKTVSLRFDKNGELVVRAPYFTPKKEIERIIATNEIKLSQMKDAVMIKKEAQDSANLSSLEEKLRNTVFPLIDKYSAVLGVAPNKIRFSNAKRRYGSCSSDKTVIFSRYLALYPDDAIEYVVVHELCHLIHMNHSKAFYLEIERTLPDWRERRNKLTLV